MTYPINRTHLEVGDLIRVNGGVLNQYTYGIVAVIDYNIIVIHWLVVGGEPVHIVEKLTQNYVVKTAKSFMRLS